MNPKLVRTEQAHYVADEWTGQNESGIAAIGDNVLVLTDKASEKAGENSTIYVPDDIRERQSSAAETGIVVALGEGAFRWNYDRSKPFSGERPQIGQRVFFERYAGTVVVGPNDGRKYRLMTDKCVGAVQASAVIASEAVA